MTDIVERLLRLRQSEPDITIKNAADEIIAQRKRVEELTSLKNENESAYNGALLEIGELQARVEELEIALQQAEESIDRTHALTQHLFSERDLAQQRLRDVVGLCVDRFKQWEPFIHEQVVSAAGFEKCERCAGSELVKIKTEDDDLSIQTSWKNVPCDCTNGWRPKDG